MKEEIRKLSEYRLVRAYETFQEGLILLKSPSLRGAVNRFYYAAFYAARALLASKELDSPKHSGVISLFHEHFVKTGRVKVEIARALSRAFEKRQDSDYEDFASFTLAEVEDLREKVEAFIGECERVLGRG